MYSANTTKRLNEIAAQQRPLIMAAIKEVLGEARYTNTGRGVSSVVVNEVDGNENRSASLLIEFEDYLNLLDKSKLQWTKLPNIKKLLEWASTKESDPKAAKRLAWATAWNQKKNDTWKPKKWRKKSLSSVLKNMNQQILVAFDAAIGEDLEEAIKRAA